MALENLIAYVVVLGLPFWLVAEEVLYRLRPGREAQASTARSADLERRAPEGAHVSSV